MKSKPFGLAIAGLAIGECIAIILLSSKSDYEPASFDWETSIMDIDIVALSRLVLVPLYFMCCYSSGIFVSCLSSAVLGLMAVFGIVKICASNVLHERSLSIHWALWIAVIIPFVEAVFLLLHRISLARRDVVGDVEIGNVADDITNPLLNYIEEDSQNGNGTSMRRILTLAWPERYIIGFALVCLFISSATQLLCPALVSQIIISISETKDINKLNEAVLLLLLIFTVTAFFSMLRGALFSLAGERVVARFRVRIFDAVISQDISFFDVNQSGEIQSRLNNDATKIQSACTTNISMGIRWLMQSVVGLIILFVLSPRLTLVMMAVLPFIGVFARIFGTRVKFLSTQYQEALARSSEVAEQAFSSIRTVRSFSQESHELKNYNERITESYKMGVKTAWAYGCILGGISLTAYFSVSLVLWYGGQLIINGSDKLDSGKLTAFLLYAIYMAVALGGLSSLYSELMTAVGASERLFEIIDRVPKMHTDKVDKDMTLQSKMTLKSSTAGLVTFDNVEFTYPARPGIRVIDGISFECVPGTVNALVGESGSGKSTIINLLLRFYDPDKGSVSIDGHDIRKMNTVVLHSIVGVVSQMPVLFSMSIEDNIRYGVHHYVTDEEVRNAAEEANAHGFIEKFPNKYKTLVGERGVTLSGGERQRVAIARALLLRPKILLLDEATSALDSTSEALVQEALEHIMKGKTSIVIAHRLGTVRMANVISVVSNGKIVEQGTHDELMKKSGAYVALVHRQINR